MPQNISPSQYGTTTGGTANATSASQGGNGIVGGNYIGVPTQTQQGGSNQSTYVGQDGNVYNASGQKVGSAGVPTGQTPTNSYNPVQLTAQISNPIPSAPTSSTVINSQAAEQHLSNVGTQIQNLNADANNQSATQAQTPAPQPSQPQQTPQTPDQTTNDPASQLNDQINDILTSLGNGENGVDEELNGEQTTNNEGQPASFQDAEQENQMQEAQQYQQYATQLASIQQGTYPLSPAESQLLSSTQGQFSQAIQQQNVANQAYTGQITEAMASLGINTSAPTEAMGNIFGAISTGQSKISELNTQMAQSLANLQLGFQKQDFDQVQTEWDNMSKQFEDRQSALSTMQSQVTAALNQQKADMVDYAKTAISAIQSVATMNYNEKQDTIKNLLAQQTFTETQQKDLVDEQQNQEKINLQAQAQAGTGGPDTTSTPVTMNGDGSVNAAQQSTFLQNLPSNVASIVKGLANYSLNPSSFSTSAKQAQGGLTQGELVNLASQYDPTYSQSNYANRQALVKNFTSGQYSQNINALNTAVGHIADLTGNFTALGNTGFTPYNAAKNTVESIFGSGAQGAATLNISAATGELATAFKKSGATDAEISSLGTLDANSSPDQVKAYQTAATQLLASRLSALEDTFTAGMGKPPAQGFLSSDSQSALLQLQQSGVDIKVPELAKAPVVQLQTFHDSDPQNASLMDALVQADPTLKNDPARMVSLLQDQGYLQ